MSSLNDYFLLSCFLTSGFIIQVVSFLFLNMFVHISWCLHSILSSETVSEASLSSLLGKRDALLEELDYFLRNSFQLHSESRSKTQLAYWVSTHPMISKHIFPAFFALYFFYGVLKNFRIILFDTAIYFL